MLQTRFGTRFVPKHPNKAKHNFRDQNNRYCPPCINTSILHSNPTQVTKSFLPRGLPSDPPAWPAGPGRASVLPAWASVLPFLAFRTPVGHQLDAKWTTIGRQVDANWTPSECQVGLPKRLPVSTYVLRTPRRLPRPTERLANSTSVAG